MTITYPGFVIGPHDPWVGESATIVRDAMTGRVPLAPPGRVPVADVRDVAAVHAAVVGGRHRPRRYIAASELVALADVLRSAASISGRRYLRLPLPLGYEGPWTAVHGVEMDNSATVAELGVRFRPAAQTIEETARWLVDSGHVPPRNRPA